MAEKKAKITQEDIMSLLDKVYDGAIHGIHKVSPPVSQLATEYISKHQDIPSAAKSFIKYQIAKCATSGFVTGLGGIITLPVAIPANVGSVLYVPTRMIATLAHMAGYDTHSDQVQTLVYACLAGISVDQIVKKAGIEFGERMANAMITKIPGSTLKAINNKVGFRFITKFGEKGIINLGKMLPAVGGVISGGFDFFETRMIAKRAYKMFILSDFSSSDEDSGVIDVDFEEVNSEAEERKI